jgi:magnesium transporter
VARGNLRWLLNREFKVACLNGMFWAVLVGIAATWVFEDPVLGLVLGIAMIVNILTAAFTGTLLPALLRRVGIDPAIAGGVILTTFTDVTGFFTFLGLATWAFAH